MIDARFAFLSCTPWHIHRVLFLNAKIQLISTTSKSFNTKNKTQSASLTKNFTIRRNSFDNKESR